MKGSAPRLIFWELTKRCNLTCAHCRADAWKDDFKGELGTDEVKSIINNIAAFAKPIMVLTGGEPLYREDIFEIAHHASTAGLKVALATNGTMIDPSVAERIKKSGITRVSISIDGSSPAVHDSFRGIQGSFNLALKGAEHLKESEVEFQFNTTITKRNVQDVDRILDLALSRGAKALHVFMLVPVGCGVEIAESDMITKEKYEEVLNWFYSMSKKVPIEIKATCAPHYYRIIRQRAKGEGRKLQLETDGMSAMTRGCLAGTGVCFISYRGEVQPCGYLPVSAGNVTENKFSDIWNGSAMFSELRDFNLLTGKCGICEYRGFCGGCRARAYYATGDYLAEEPFCVYIPEGSVAG
ncbi:MAG: radical SAM protein [Spirochaetes bacterium]|jgi:heme b synthase|nr:radical SAM protein [Spirochaetota bacterium]